MRSPKPTPENAIHFPSHIHIIDVRRYQHALNELIEFRGYETIYLNFLDTTVAFADAMLPLVALIRRYQDEGVRFALTLPLNEKLRRLFINTDWAHFIDPAAHPRTTGAPGRNLPTREFKSAREQHETVDRMLEKILGTVTVLEREHLSALEWSLQEITDNVLQHSESPVGGLVQLSVHPVSKELEFVVADAGVGVPASLRSTLRPGISDADVLQEAVKEGVTRGTGQGNGLFGSFQICALSGAPFSINAGSAYLALDRQGIARSRQEDLPFTGTTVACVLNFGRPLLLEQSLRIAGRAFSPTDFVETRYEGNDENTIRMTLKDEAESFGSRMSGFEVRRKIKNLMRMSNGSRIILDAVDIGIMSSSFADEAFAKLRIEMGQDAYSEKIVFQNLQPINRQIILRSITQRLRDESSRSA